LKKFIYLIITAITCCAQPFSGKTDTFIVPVDSQPVFKWTDTTVPPLPPPSRVYYMPFNFIIDTSEQILFYQRERTLDNDAVVAWDTPPEFINLQPKDIIQLPKDEIEEFMTLNILNSGRFGRVVAIASTEDTIKSKGLSTIASILRQNRVPWKFRKVTQEEIVVLDYKRRYAVYYSGSIKWDSTKIRFK
jgi:hypothetical protein